MTLVCGHQFESEIPPRKSDLVWCYRCADYRTVALKQRPVLTQKEREVLNLAITGMTDQAIAKQLNVSYSTVERRISRAMNKLECRTRLQLGLALAREEDDYEESRNGAEEQEA